MNHKIIIDQEWLNKSGDYSLIGQVSIETRKDTPLWPEQLILVFPQTSWNTRLKNNGPDAWVMPEHAVACLMRDVISLGEKGVEIIVKMTYEL